MVSWQSGRWSSNVLYLFQLFTGVHWHEMKQCTFSLYYVWRCAFSACAVSALPLVLWHCWLGGKKGIRPVKNFVLAWLSVWSEMQTCIWPSWCHCHSLSCFSKIQIGFTFLVPAHPGGPGKRAVKRVCVYGWRLTVDMKDCILTNVYLYEYTKQVQSEDVDTFLNKKKANNSITIDCVAKSEEFRGETECSQYTIKFNWEV